MAKRATTPGGKVRAALVCGLIDEHEAAMFCFSNGPDLYLSLNDRRGNLRRINLPTRRRERARAKREKTA